MPIIDWTSPGFLLTLASLGALLMVLGVLFYFLPPARIKGLAIAVSIVGGLALGTALGLRLVPGTPPAIAEKSAEPAPPEPNAQTPSVPAEHRMPAGNAPAWYTVRRGDVVLTLVERGMLESADNADIVVKFHAPKPGGAAATIKSIVADGATVKKDQLLVELDAAGLAESLKAQKLVVEQAQADQAQVRKQAELDTERAQLDLEEAHHQLALAERDLKTYAGSDAQRKKGLELRVKEAQQLVKTREFQTITTKTRTENLQQTTQALFEAETAKAKELEAEIGQCKMHAPRDGQVFYHVPPAWSDSQALLAPGKSVAEGQKLLYLPDLSRMQVRLSVRESQLAHLRLDQPANVRVDAFPGRVLGGKVVKIGNAAERQVGMKSYPAVIALADEKLGLKPSMSAEVRIELERHTNVLRVPVQALREHGNRTVCFVRSGDEMQERPVAAGLRDDLFAEITEGLKEGEQVLRAPD